MAEVSGEPNSKSKRVAESYRLVCEPGRSNGAASNCVPLQALISQPQSAITELLHTAHVTPIAATSN
jgi:hypothetical protein